MSKTGDDTVRDLLERSRRGDVDALNRLCVLLHEQVFQRILGRVRDEDVSDELAQNTMIWFLRNYKDRIHDENIPALLAAKAFFLLKSHFRAKYILKEVSLESMSEERDIADTSAVDTLDERVDRREIWKKIVDDVERLPSDYKEVITRRYYQDLSFQEIARDLHLSEANVRQRHKRAIDMLKKRFQKKNGVEKILL
jgi:RNA polymerase sigma-70 factor (ECF subfamily)